MEFAAPRRLHPHPSGGVVAKERATTVPLDLPRGKNAGEEINRGTLLDLSAAEGICLMEVVGGWECAVKLELLEALALDHHDAVAFLQDAFDQ